MDFECAFVPELKELVARPALTIRTRTRVSNIAALFDKGYSSIARLLKERGKEPAEPPFAIYYNMDMDNDIEVEFGFPVDEPLEGSGSITASATPSGKSVATLYIGPYEEVAPAYDYLMKWCTDNNLMMNGTAYEIYLNDPSDTPPEMLKTQIHLLLNEG
ncbi:MAG: GyrI-like domain-containing protein [Chlorobiaceae bacterium]|nr:GyrI-like domain-containing protein [Chlorobiaceae bacterium]